MTYSVSLYLAIFSKLNEVTKPLQGKTITTFVVKDHIIAKQNNFWY